MRRDVPWPLLFDDGVTLFDIAEMTMELEELPGCRVDVIEDAGLRHDNDAIRAEAVAL